MHTKLARNDDFSFPLALLLSLFVHVILFTLLLNPLLSKQNTPQYNYIDVSIEPPQEASQAPITRNQIVTAPKPPEEQKATSPQSTNKVAEEDSFVKKEQVKRGMPDASKNIARQSSQQDSATTQQQLPKIQPQKEVGNAKPSSSKSAPNLKLSSSELLESLDGIAIGSPAKQPSSNTVVSAPAPRPFSRPLGSGARFLGNSGSPDFLPNLPDGDITLLNAKANQFAVFVRRVAIQVFTNIRAMGWDDLTQNDIRAIAKDTHILAKMSPTGQLLSVTLLNSSASTDFDSIIIKAAKAGTKDPNPPAAAVADDGNIRFIFKARSWSEVFAGRGGIPTERRWIMLSTGLE